MTSLLLGKRVIFKRKIMQKFSQSELCTAMIKKGKTSYINMSVFSKNPFSALKKVNWKTFI